MTNLTDGINETIAAWESLKTLRTLEGMESFEVIAFQDFQLGHQDLTKEQRKLILEQASLLFSNFYVHMPFKFARTEYHPLDELARIESMLDELSDDVFHMMVRDVFILACDDHTRYGLPAPYRGSLAFLPFRMKQYFDDRGQRRFVVAKVMDAWNHAHFKEGVEVISWMGKDILDAIEEVALTEVGANQDAFVAFGVERMSLRPLTFAQRPAGSLVELEYLDLEGKVRLIHFPWGVVKGLGSSGVFGRTCGSANEYLAQFRKGSQLVWNSNKFVYECEMKKALEAKAFINLERDSKFSSVFEFQYPGGESRSGFLTPSLLSAASRPDAKFGYIRIKNFDIDHEGIPREDEIAEEFKRILELLMDKAPDGLIIDVRSNPGGNVRLAEKLLQMLTPQQVEPAKFHWRWNRTTKDVLKTLDGLQRRQRRDDENELFVNLLPDFIDWISDLTPGTKRPRFLSGGRNITEASAANDTGQIYQGPVVLLIDSFTYSAGDIFAASFQDHEIGPILGVSKATGGGGATMKRFSEIQSKLTQVTKLPLQPLPEGVTMTVAVQRCTRVKKFEGRAFEGTGVKADIVHMMTLRDIMEGNSELIGRACELLAMRKAYRLEIDEMRLKGKELQLRISSKGVEQFKAIVNGSEVDLVRSRSGIYKISGVDGTEDLELTVIGLDDQGNTVVSKKKVLEAA